MLTLNQEWATKLIKARHARTEEGDELFQGLLDPARDLEVAKDPFVVQTLISTFHDDCSGDGIDTEVYNILLELEPQLWIRYVLRDLSRLSREAYEAGSCLLEFATSTPEAMLEEFDVANADAKVLTIDWMKQLSRSDEERGISSDIGPMLSKLRASIGL